jgi:hypothetical protein
MAYVPQGAKWYVAEIIEEITVEGDPRNVVHKNLVLIQADSPDEAYAKAVELGSEHDSSYDNPTGKLVRARFRGLGYLDVIHDDLEHGAELLYEQKTSVPEERIQEWVLPKERLTVFRKEEPALDHPDYSAKDIVEEASKMLQSGSNRNH